MWFFSPCAYSFVCLDVGRTYGERAVPGKWRRSNPTVGGSHSFGDLERRREENKIPHA